MTTTIDLTDDFAAQERASDGEQLNADDLRAALSFPNQELRVLLPTGETDWIANPEPMADGKLAGITLCKGWSVITTKEAKIMADGYPSALVEVIDTFADFPFADAGPPEICPLCELPIETDQPTVGMLIDLDAGNPEVGPDPDVQLCTVHTSCAADPTKARNEARARYREFAF